MTTHHFHLIPSFELSSMRKTLFAIARNKASKRLQLPLQPKPAHAAKSSVHIVNAPATWPSSASNPVARWKVKAWRMLVLLNVQPHLVPRVTDAHSKATTRPYH